MTEISQSKLLSPMQIRDQLEDMVIKDLLGPAGGPDEELAEKDRVTERYLIGMLAPKKEELEASLLDEIATDGADDVETGPTDKSATPKDTFFPSSMGLSFMVEPEVRKIQVETEWGRYQKIESETQKKKDGSPARTFKRIPYQGESQAIILKDGAIGQIYPSKLDPNVMITGKIRKTSMGWVVTLFFVNIHPQAKTNKDEAWIFQPKMKALGIDQSPVFVQRHNLQADLGKLDPISREEIETLEMLYRHRLEFAVGHGVSVHVTLPFPGSEKALSVETEFIPKAEVCQQTPPTVKDHPGLADLVLDMKELAEMPKADLVSNLRILEKAYQNWIDAEEKKINDPEEKLTDHRSAALRAIQRCKQAHDRIKEGIDLIDSDSITETAFRFANRAMWLQRVHTMLSRGVRKEQLDKETGLIAVDVPRNRSWRHFQLAFILLNLPSLTQLDHPDRSHETKAVADLLWFPTGGGKTEAYLGLAAYTFALRRLQGDIEGFAGDHGVAVLMRYTLRLLTLQQFQRATALLCACEIIRREDPSKWGSTPFRLGLWVGQKTTPNNLSTAAESLRQKKTGSRPSLVGTPHQITYCPWCGTEVTENDIEVYEAPSDIGRCITYCGDHLGNCPFSRAKSPKEGLPAMIVDEDIYRRPPSLLISTVDKFAQMPWKGETQMLFGRVNGFCERHGFTSPEIKDAKSHPAKGSLPSAKQVPHQPLRPPDLIIQDELHLISGPLGSMVGLYEVAVDELCGWNVNGKKVRPKVIASTATIRRAPDQIKKLFLRDLQVFPPQGTHIKDNFFSIQREVSAKYPGRRYLGVCAFGRRYPVALIRLYVALLGGAQALYDKYDNLADPWMTLTGYFNSIRELAGTRRLVGDDVNSRLRDADKRGLAKRRLRLGTLVELTSRQSGTDIPKILERLEISFDKTMDAKRVAQRKANEKINPPYPYDVVLATNMISVGVDIDRLGLMVVGGQPKNTSEYIQASSRVGRTEKGPGLVITVYNWARPRDLSHYETFEHYHSTFYKHVEPLSVTPFSPRALQRGLSGVFVSLMRLWDEHLNLNRAAGKLTDTDPMCQEIFKKIINRASLVMESDEVRILVDKLLQTRRDYWLNRIHNAHDHDIGYRNEPQSVVGLLLKPEVMDWELFTCLNSLRDVEGSVNMILDRNSKGLLLFTEQKQGD